MGASIVVAAGGGIETALLPHRLLYFRADYDVTLTAALSSGALDFVTRTALAGVTGRPVVDPETRFDPLTARPAHLALADADLLVLYPATARILAQCAAGEVTCPVTRLFAFTAKTRILVAPAIHPRMDRRIYAPHVDRLRALDCEVLGGDELRASWDEVERRVIAKLGLVKLPTAGGDVDLDVLSRRASAVRPSGS